MGRVGAMEFAEAYLKELRERGSWAQYTEPPWSQWTTTACDTARVVMRSFGLYESTEYLRLDAAGWETGDTGRSDWDWFLRIAFEHENNPNAWRDELCKLAYIVSDLRVLVAYDAGDAPAVKSKLEDAICQLGDRMRRVPGVEWLFLFGPYSAAATYSDKDKYVAFRYADSLSLEELKPDAAFAPVDFDDAPLSNT